MNRVIKFRAWIPRSEQMINVDVLAISPVGWDSGGTGVSLAYQPHIKVMQFTGLHDKNGVEIYEGDLLKLNTSLLKLSFMGDYNFGYILHHAITGDYHCMLNVDHLKRIEVVGNNYQHPHLLEGS